MVKGESGVQSHSDLDGVGSIPAIPNARYVPSLLCHERFNEASLPDIEEITIQNSRNEIKIESSESQKLFCVGNAFTIHACQGMSIETPYTNWEWKRLNKK